MSNAEKVRRAMELIQALKAAKAPQCEIERVERYIAQHSLKG